MAWRDDLRQASFRGVPFFVDVSDTAGGRRLAEHEYPGRDVPFVEDLGRSAREFMLEAYVIGENYFAARDALLNALEEAGQGELVHPYQGIKNVIVRSPFRMREVKSEGGMVRFSITFVEAGVRENPVSSSDDAFSISTASGGLISRAKEKFADVLVMVGVPEFVREAAGEAVENVTEVLKNVEVESEDGGLVAEFLQQVEAIQDDPVSALLDASGFADQIADLMNKASTIAGGGKKAVAFQKTLYDIPADPSQGTSATQQTADANRAAVVELTQSIALAEAATQAQAADYESFEGAVATRDGIIDDIDANMQTADYETFMRLQAVRSVLVEVVPGEAEQLPHLETVVLPQTTNNLVLAYDLYEDISRADEIAKRNNVRHPGFLNSGVPLEVLSDV